MKVWTERASAGGGGEAAEGLVLYLVWGRREKVTEAKMSISFNYTQSTWVVERNYMAEVVQRGGGKVLCGGELGIYNQCLVEGGGVELDTFFFGSKCPIATATVCCRSGAECGIAPYNTYIYTIYIIYIISI